MEPVKEALLADFTSAAFAEPLIVISETALPSMWLFEPLMTTVFVPAGISMCALDSSTVKVPEASDLSESAEASVLVSVRGLAEASGAGEAVGRRSRRRTRSRSGPR